MKRVCFVILLVLVLLSLVGCGKSTEAKQVEELINNIGEISVDHYETVKNARDGYDALTDEQKNEVENLTVLTDAEAELEELVEQIKNEATEYMLDRKPEEAIALLENVLDMDPSIQEYIDIIYGWCFDINGVLIELPSILYSGVELIEAVPHKAGEEFDSYFYTLVEFDDFSDYISYLQEKFVLDKGNSFSDEDYIYVQLNDPVSGEFAVCLGCWLIDDGERLMLHVILPPSDRILDK